MNEDDFMAECVCTCNISIDLFVAEQIEHVKGNLEWRYISFKTL